MDNFVVILIMLMSIGAAQGLIFGVILYKTIEGNKVANGILATLLVLLSYRLIIQIMRLFGLGYYDTWYYFMLDLSWIHGTLIYFYVLAHTSPDFSIKKNQWWHFIPVLLQACFSLFVRIQNFYWDGSKESLSWLGYWGYWLWMNQPTIHIIASSLIVYYAVKSEKVLSTSSTKKFLGQERLIWLRRIITTFKWYFILVLLIILTDLLFFKVTSNDYYFYFTRFYYYPFFIGISVLTYWIGIEGFNRRKIKKNKMKPVMSQSKLSQLQDIAKALRFLMKEDKIYLDPELNVQKVAQALNVKPYLLSQCLSEVLGLRFNDYVNGFRIEHVRKLLAQPQKYKQNLLTLALEAGFNSKSSFNRAVKNQLGIHPRELRTKHKT